MRTRPLLLLAGVLTLGAVPVLYARAERKRRAQNPPLPFREEQRRRDAHARIMADGPVPLPLVGEAECEIHGPAWAPKRKVA